MTGSPHSLPGAAVSTLPNGLTVLVHQDDRFPLVALRLYAKIGSAKEPAQRAGISHVLEHMVFKGTRKLPAGASAARIESVGGYLNAATSFDYTAYIAELPSKHLALGLDVLGDMALDATLSAKDLATEKQVILSELERNEDSPGTRVFNMLQAMAWAGDGYERPIIGTRETVSALTPAHLKSLRKRFYQPGSMLLVACGNASPKTVTALAQELFGHLENHSPARPAAAKPLRAPAPPRVRVERGPWNKAYVGLALPLPPTGTPDIPGCEALAQMLGGDRTALLHRKYKYELRLVDTLSVSSVTLERRGMLLVQATLPPKNLEPFWQGVTSDLAGLAAKAFSDQDLKRAKLNLEDSLLRSMETLAGMASKLGYFQLFEKGPQSEHEYLESLARLDRESIQSLIERYVRMERAAAVALMPDSFDGPGPEDLARRMEAALAPAQTDAANQAEAPARRRSARPAAMSGAPAPRMEEPAPGCTLALLPDASLPYAALDLVFRGGDGLLDPGEQGLAQLASRILTKGTRHRTATAIQDLLGDCAAQLTANANRDNFSLHARFPTRFQAEITELMLEIATQASFPDEEVEREQESQAAAIKAAEDKPLSLAFRHLFPLLFSGHHYAFLHMGLEETLPGLGRDQAMGFWLKQRQAPWTLAACGDFDAQGVRDLARNLAEHGMDGSVHAGEAAAGPAWTRESKALLTLADRNQAHLLLCFPGKALGHPDTAGLRLLRAVLGGQGGILFPRLRDELGLGYQVSAYNWQGRDDGFLALYLGTQPERMDEALLGFKDLVQDLGRNLVRPEALNRGKNLMLGNYFRDHQTAASRSLEAATLGAQGLKQDTNRAHVESARRMSRTALRELIREHLDWDKVFILKVLP